jgi:hypothetical protein
MPYVLRQFLDARRGPSPLGGNGTRSPLIARATAAHMR